MNKYRYILFIALTFLFLGACSNNKEIKEAAYQYSYAMANYRVDEAEPYSTQETISSTLEIARRMITKIDTSYIISDTPAEITITKIEQTSDTSAYAIYHKVTPIKDFSDTLQLRKREGKWLAHAPIQKVPRRHDKKSNGLTANKEG